MFTFCMHHTDHNNENLSKLSRFVHVCNGFREYLRNLPRKFHTEYGKCVATVPPSSATSNTEFCVKNLSFYWNNFSSDSEDGKRSVRKK